MLTKQVKDPHCYAYEGICEVSCSVGEKTREESVFRLGTEKSNRLGALVEWKKGKFT